MLNLFGFETIPARDSHFLQLCNVDFQLHWSVNHQNLDANIHTANRFPKEKKERSALLTIAKSTNTTIYNWVSNKFLPCPRVIPHSATAKLTKWVQLTVQELVQQNLSCFQPLKFIPRINLLFLFTCLIAQHCK